MTRLDRSLMVSLFAMVMTAFPALAQDTTTIPPPPPCSSPEARQFDFWVGTWDLTWEGGKGTNVVESKLNRCVIQENFDGRDQEGNGLVGMSTSVYNPAKEKWLQTWVDNQGGYLDFEGELDHGKMTLGREAERNGVRFLQRMVFFNITDDALDWNWERSDDGGKTWNTTWTIHYQRRK